MLIFSICFSAKFLAGQVRGKQLALAFVLIDCRHKPQPIDLEFMQWLGVNAIPFHIIFTKADKLKPNALKRNIKAYTEEMLLTWEEMPKYFITSSSNSTGREEVLAYIDNLNNELNALPSKA